MGQSGTQIDADVLAPDWGFASRRDVAIQIRLSRNLVIAIIASLLLHALALFMLYRHHVLDLKPPIHAGNGSFDVELTQPEARKPQSAQRAEVTHIRSHVKESHAAKRKVIALKKLPSDAFRIPAPEPKPKPKPKPRAVPPMSFLDAVNAARAHRGAAQNDYPGNAAPSAANAMGPFPDQGNNQPQGTSGIFQILRMGDNSAELSFLGWHSEYSNSHKEVFEVEAGPDGDVRLAIVRKMIEIIRKYYKGDFNWNSDRLGSVVVLSARVQDTRELEAFLMKDFFGAGSPGP